MFGAWATQALVTHRHEPSPARLPASALWRSLGLGSTAVERKPDRPRDREHPVRYACSTAPRDRRFSVRSVVPVRDHPPSPLWARDPQFATQLLGTTFGMVRLGW